MIENILQNTLSVLFKVTCVLIIPILLTPVLRRASAAIRHAAWTAAILGAITLPLLSLVTPSWRIAPPAALLAKSTAPPAPSPASYNPIAPSLLPISESMQRPSAKAAKRAFLAPHMQHDSIALMWLMGFLMILGRIALGLRQAAQEFQSAASCDERAARIAEEAQACLSGYGRIRVRIAAPHSCIAAPITWGALRPVVLLPAQSHDWTDDCLRTVLLHEFAHIRRMDWVTRMASHLACATYWFHPLIWIAARQLRETSERACDDCVLNAGVAPVDYAQHLVNVLRSLPEGAKPHTAAIAMALPNETEGRIRAMLTNGLNRKGISRQWAIGTAALALAIIAPIAALRVAAKTETNASDSNPTSEVVYTGGGKIKLLGVSYDPSTGKPWWDATGARLSQPPTLIESGSTINQHENASTFRFAFQPLGMPEDADYTLSAASASGATGSGSHREYGVTTLSITTQMLNNVHTTSVRIGVASGPWETVEEFGPLGSAMGSPTWRGRAITIGVSEPSLFFGNAGLTVTNTVIDDASRVVAVDKHNVIHVGDNPSGQSNGTTQMRSVYFDGMKITDIKKILFQARTYEWREFKNIALEPKA